MLEEKVNEKIRKNNAISVEVVDLEDDKWKSVRCQFPKLYPIILTRIFFKQVRTRGLPEDVQNEIRIISIDGIDANVCCGTHVTSLSQLQVIGSVTGQNFC